MLEYSEKGDFMKKNELGEKGESFAARYLEDNCGYTIVAKNYKNKIGEIDIIAQDHKTIVFVEVKTRKTVQYGFPSEAVDKRKQHKIANVAACYLSFKKLWQYPCRFDVIEVYANDETTVKINHIKNAFIL